MQHGQQEFAGGVFNEKLPSGRAGASIVLDQSGIQAFTPDQKQFQIPWSDACVELGGTSGKMLFCRNHGRSITIFSEAPGFIHSVRNFGGPILGSQFAPIERKMAHKRMGVMAFWSICLGLLGLLAWGGLKIWTDGLDGAVDAIPYSVDEAIGEYAWKSMDLGGAEIKSAKPREAIEKLLKQIGQHRKLKDSKFEFKIIRNPATNAFALPGGKIVVFSGLIEKAQRAEQVAGVLAHEISHVTLRHGVERLIQSAGVVTLIQLSMGDATGLLAVAAKLASIAAVNQFSQVQESAADTEGTHMLYQAGINPEGLYTDDFFLLSAHRA